ncbi:Ionotropic receptor 199 [Hyalella azteca]|uniref:Ionotropic receptor 199 n=1 Tax=Hyalella azteca TaxID=294128 RepID=A0A6A0H080_HYAAZ|nr:Ionotropic receptor 199 [Hyalella azteca]
MDTADRIKRYQFSEEALKKTEWVPAVALITKLLLHMKINEVYVCSLDDEFFFVTLVLYKTVAEKRPSLHTLLSLRLPRALLYTGACNATQLQLRARQLQDTAQSIDTGAIPSYRYRSAVLYLADPGQETEILELFMEHDSLTRGSFYGILISSFPKSCYESPSLRTIYWMNLSFSKAKKSVLVHETYSFRGADEPIVVQLGEVPPYVMQLPKHCMRGRAAVDPEIQSGILGPDDDFCPLAHHAWRRLFLSNTSQRHVPVALQEPLYGGYLVDLLMTLAHKLNFSVMLHFPPPGDEFFGLDSGDGNFTGLVGALQRREVDLSLGPFTMTRDRLRFIDFSVAVDRTSASLFINQAAVVSAVGWTTYVLSFHWTAWVALLMLLAICTVVLVLVVRHDKNEDQYFGESYNATFIFFSCLVQQGLSRLPVTARAKTVLFLFWMSSSVLYTFYTARLTSSFTTSSALPFNGLKEAMSSPSWKIGLLAGTSLLDILRSSEGSKYEELYVTSQESPSLFVNSDEEGVSRVLSEERFAYFCESSSVLYLLRGNCSIMKVPGEHLPRYQHFGYSKHLPFADVLNAE